MTTFGAVVLAGGTGSRLGGVDKGALRPEGAGAPSLLESVVGALPDGTHCVVVGDRAPGAPAEIVWAREDPPGSGPLAGLAAGVAALDTAVDVVVTLACDLPDLDTGSIAALLDALGDHEVALGTDSGGREQYLLAAWDRAAVEARLRAIGAPEGLPVRRLFEVADAVRVALGAATADLDTWADVAARGPLDLALLPGALSVLAPLPQRTTGVLDARGVLATDLVAAEPMPRLPVSAMDGYAVAGPPPWALESGDLLAGPAGRRSLEPGSAVTIATGAVAPAGTERVLRHELVRVSDTDPAAGSHIGARPEAEGVDDLRPAGEDWARGAVLARSGDEVDAVLRSAALSAGVKSLTTRGPVRCRVVTSGDEIAPVRAPGPLADGIVRDTAGPVLPGVLRAAGMVCADDVQHVGDDPEVLGELLSAPGDVEVLALVGATGRGPADHLRGALRRLEARILLDGLRIRPGGSQLVALLPDGRVLLALPGNPLAAVCAAAVTGRAVVDALTGRRRREIEADLPEHDHPARTLVLPTRPGPAGWEVVPRPRTSHLADLAGFPYLACVSPAGRATLLRTL